MKQAIGRVYKDNKIEVPDWFLRELKNPKEVKWVERSDGKIYVERSTRISPFDFAVGKKQSTRLKHILGLLNDGPLHFGELHEQTSWSPRTLTQHLNRAKKEQLVKHKSRKAPYQITEKGREFLETIQTRPVEEFALEFIRGEHLGGSIVFRVPKRFYQVYSTLFTPPHLESLRKMFLLTFEFWGTKYCQSSPHVRLEALGRDFNRDGIWDLTIFETPPGGYPCVKKAIKNGEIPREFQFQQGLEALEFLLKTGLYKMRKDPEATELFKLLAQIMHETKRGGKNLEKTFTKLLGIPATKTRALKHIFRK